MFQPELSRRTLLKQAIAAATASSLARAAGSQEVTVRIFPDENLGVTPSDFLGLGYEISSVAVDGLLDARNTALLPFIRTLGRRGVIRVGGNTSDLSIWSPDGQAAAHPKGTVTSRASIQALGSWLQATGWDLIWGVNLGQGTEESAAEQAAAVKAAAGDHLLAVEVGNEPDLYSKNGLRKPGYTYTGFHRDFQRFVDVLQKRTPGIPLAGPDVAESPDWVTRFAKDEGKRLRVLTEHYYAAGPPDNPKATIENLLRTDDGFVRMTRQLQAASKASGVPYRFVEVNSCFGGGKPGMSDTFASALWGLDLMFTLATNDGAGINWQTGVNHLGFVSSYSPIWDDEHANYSARPLYYGLLAFSLSGIGRRFPVVFDATGVNLRGWGVVSRDGYTWLTLINKDTGKEAIAHVKSVRKFGSAGLLELSAPAVDSRSGVTLGGSAVSDGGVWKEKQYTPIRVKGGEFEIRVPPARAFLIRMPLKQR